MGLFKRLKRNAALATGDFQQIFGEFTLPPCPDVVIKLIEAVNDPDVFIDQVVKILETDPALTSLILKTVNSALYGLPGNVSSVFKAVSILGLKEIENIALGYAMRKSLKDPGLGNFNFNIFWTDSLYRALFAKYSAVILQVEAEEAFAAALLQDMAIPLLLTEWLDVYRPVYDDWSSGLEPVHEVEKRHLSWNHCQAAAWIAANWGLPDLLVCCVGLHSAAMPEIKELGLEETAVKAVSLSSRVTPVFRNPASAPGLLEHASSVGISDKQLFSVCCEVEDQLENLAVSLDIKTVERPPLQEIIEETGRSEVQA